MTKAQEALDDVYNEDEQKSLPHACLILKRDTINTIRKALELLDKVEQGGLDVNVLEKPKEIKCSFHGILINTDAEIALRSLLEEVKDTGYIYVSDVNKLRSAWLAYKKQGEVNG